MSKVDSNVKYFIAIEKSRSSSKICMHDKQRTLEIRKRINTVLVNRLHTKKIINLQQKKEEERICFTELIINNTNYLKQCFLRKHISCIMNTVYIQNKSCFLVLNCKIYIILQFICQQTLFIFRYGD